MPTFKNQNLEKLLNVTYKSNYISDFSQSGRSDTGSGVCMGMCLDWIRRIKNAKFKTGESIYSYKDSNGLKKEKRIKKIIETHNIRSGISKPYIKNIFDNEENDLIVKITWSDYKVDISNTPKKDWDDKIFIETKMDHKAYENIIDKYLKIIQQPDYGLKVIKKHSAGIAKTVYQQFQQDWENQMLKHKSIQVPVSKNITIPFTNKVLFTTTVNTTVNYTEKRKANFNSIKIASQFVDASSSSCYDGNGLFQGFVSGCAHKLNTNDTAILSLGKDKESGHDVAFYNDGNSLYYFDPNLGEFLFDIGKIDSDFKNVFIGVFDIVYKNFKYTWSSWNTYQ